MIIESLRLKNWCQHRSKIIDFRPSINGILGSNGKGKSNLLDALRFVFTGQSINDGDKADNLTWGETKGHVEVTFTVGTTRYELTRHIDTPKVILTFDDTKITKSAEVATELTRAMSATPKTLLDNVFIPQGKINEILELKAADRLKEFQATFGLTRMETAYQLLGIEANGFAITPGLAARLDETVSVIVTERANVSELTSRVEGLTATVRALEPARLVIERALEVEKTSRTLAAAESAVTEATLAVAKTTSDANKAKHASDLASAMVTALEPHQAKATEVLQQSVTAMIAAKNNAAALERLATTKAKLTGDKPTDEALSAVSKDTSSAAAEVARFRGMLQNPATRPKLDPEIALGEALRAAQTEEAVANQAQVTLSPQTLELKGTVDHLRAELASLGTGICRACGQSVKGGPEIVAAKQGQLRSLDSELATAIVVAQQELVGRRMATSSKVASIKEQLAAFEHAAVDAITRALHVADTRLFAAQTVEGSLRGAKEVWTAYEHALASVPAAVEAPAQEAVAAARKLLQDHQEARQSHQEALRAAGIAYAVAEAAEGALHRAKAFRATIAVVTNAPTAAEVAQAQEDLRELSNRRIELESTTTSLGVAKASLDQQEREARRLKDQLAREEDDAAWVAVVKSARDALHYSKLPASLMREYARLINDRIAYYLQIWEAPFQFKLDDNLAFRAIFANGETSGSRLSGGQQVVASASFRLAMSDTFAKEVGLLILDEPSNHLDKENIQHLQQLLLKLKELSAHTGRQILVVTHEASLTGFLDHVVEI